MDNRSAEFIIRSNEAMADPQLSAVHGYLGRAVPSMRQAGVSSVGNFDELRDSVTAVKQHTLGNLAHYLTRYEAGVQANGGHVHWAETGEDLNRIVLDICSRAGARLAVKGKSMIGEETGLREAMIAAGIETLETDLGEYIIQLAGETPSHILAPALHKSQQQVADLFLEHHDLGGRSLSEVVGIVREARQVLRQRFLAADVGVTGANALVAEDGTHLLVTNEGNGDLSSTLPRVHIVVASIEKVVPTAEDAIALARVLVRSGTGQPLSAYTSFYSGPRRQGEPDGPDEFHVVLLDNGRSSMLHGEFRDMLRCIRCSACLNHCPIYWHVGGHAYGSVYAGPMGSVITPLMHDLAQTRQLPNACTACGRCEEVCPVRIPLPDLLRRLRAKVHDDALAPLTERKSIEAMMAIIRSPSAYRRGLESARHFCVGWPDIPESPDACPWPPVGLPGAICRPPREGPSCSDSIADGFAGKARVVPLTTADARARILRRIGDGQDGDAIEAAFDVLAAQRARPQLDEADPVALFTRTFTAQRGETHTIASTSALPTLVADLVTEPTSLVLDNDSELAALDWEGQRRLSLRDWEAVQDGGIAVSRGLCAVAESGTLVCASGPGNAGSINFLADQHVVVVRTSELVRFLDDAWPVLRDRLQEIPRGIFLLSGPSCTADVGGIMTFGVHGPIRLHAVLVEE